MFALVDINNFYASCEQVFRPDLIGKPIIVLSNNDGCIIARNSEAKALGIEMCTPYFKCRTYLESKQVVVFSSNYALYGDMSMRVMTLLSSLAPEIEVYSIDEAFLNVTGTATAGEYLSIGMEIRRYLKQCTHLTAGVGIAPTKTLAKLANYAAKHWPATKGVVDLSQPQRQRRLLAITAVDNVWGIGSRLAARLRLLGVDTALKLAQLDTAFVRKNFSVTQERIVRELRGESCLGVDDEPEKRQQILCSRSFSRPITDYQSMHEAVCTYAQRSAEKLRQEKQFCRRVAVFIATSAQTQVSQRRYHTTTKSLLLPTQDSRDVIAAAVDGLQQIWEEGVAYQKAGIILNDFYDSGVAQLPLFSTQKIAKNSAQLMQVIDNINLKGRNTIWFAGQGIAQPWQMSRCFLSPAYTTKLAEIAKVNA